jgi:Cytidylate kinase
MHITIAGNLGSGKSTVCKLLQQMHGFCVHSAGSIQRKVAEQMGISTLELNNLMSTNLSIDKLIDDTTTTLGRDTSNSIIFDSRMAWHFVEHSFKVFLIVDPVVAANRVVESRKGIVENYNDTDDACEQLLERGRIENERFKQIYNVDNFDYRNYDLIVDTTYLSPEDVASVIFREYTIIQQNSNYPLHIMLSPLSLYPSQSVRNLNKTTIDFCVDTRSYSLNPIAIVKYLGYHYIVDGHNRMVAAALNNEKLINVCLFDPKLFPFFSDPDNVQRELSSLSISTLYDFEDLGHFRYASYPKTYSMI